METLIRMRPIELLAFALGGFAAAYAVVSRDELVYLIGVALSFGGMTGFLATESFGRLASSRSKSCRWIARLFMVPSLLISLVLLVVIGRWALNQ